VQSSHNCLAAFTAAYIGLQLPCLFLHRRRLTDCTPPPPAAPNMQFQRNYRACVCGHRLALASQRRFWTAL